MILSELIERSKLLAIQMGNADPRLLDSEVIIEILLPRVFSVVTQNVVKDQNNLNALRTDHTIAFTNGIGTLPESIKEEYVESLFFPGLPFASYAPRYEEYSVSPQTRNIPTFTIQNRQIYFRPATLGAVVTLAGTTATRGLYTPRGTYLTKTYYVLAGNPTPETGADFTAIDNIIYWDGSLWTLNYSTGGGFYFSADNTNYPYNTLASTMTWLNNGLTNPVPLVEESISYSGNMTVNAITLPTLPAVIGDTVVLKDNLIEEVITFMASVMSGKIPLSAIALDYPALNNGPA